jgi:RimJ/RimL family protein N-acetyltransferase
MTIARAAGHTSRLTIEPLDLGHADALHRALDDPRVGAHIGGPDVTTREATRGRIEHLARDAPAGGLETWCDWAVLLETAVIGRVEATLHDGVAEIAYVFGPRWYGRGCATEAASWMVELLAPHVTACWATVAPENVASARLLDRLGFVQEEPGAVLLSYDAGDVTFVRRSSR